MTTSVEIWELIYFLLRENWELEINLLGLLMYYEKSNTC